MTKISCEVKDLSQRFQHFYLFKDISFQIDIGEVWMIKGNNGSGKSTLLKILSGGMEATKGEVVFSQNEIVLDPNSLWKRNSMVSPYQELPEELSLNELIDFQTKMLGNEEKRMEYGSFIQMFGMEKDAAKPIVHYSTGMKQKAKIILSIGLNRPILFLDEPTSNLDPESFGKFWQLIVGLKKERLIITASNDEKEIAFGKVLMTLG